MENKDIYAQALSFNPVLPGDMPPAIDRDGDGNPRINIRADKARKVSMRILDEEYPLSRGEDGIWHLKYPLSVGFAYVQLLIDDVEVLSPYLPVSYGYSRPFNSIALPEEEDFYCLKPVAHGSVRREYFFSSVTGEWESCLIYTPPGYDTDFDTAYPVLYLQHGHGENETGWVYSGKLNFILDNLIAEDKALPFLVVMNDGMVQKESEKEGRIVDHTLFPALLTEDVIPFIEANFRVKKDRKYRALAGLSMGSMQSCITAFDHPELFSYVGLFSGFMRDFIQGNEEMDDIARAPSPNAHLRVLDDAEKFQKTYPVFFRGIGRNDVFLSYFLEDDRILEEKGVSSTRLLYDGGHDWNVWRRCIRDFAKMIFRGGD